MEKVFDNDEKVVQSKDKKSSLEGLAKASHKAHKHEVHIANAERRHKMRHEDCPGCMECSK